MNIKTALKKKNKLIGLISTEFNKVLSYNSIIEGNDRPYKIKDCLSQWNEYCKELVELKTKIHQANAPVFGKIFLISELKSQIKSLKGLSCDSGKSQGYGYGSGSSDIIKTAEINVVYKEKLIKDIESEIEKLQDELDEFNYKTEI